MHVHFRCSCSSVFVAKKKVVQHTQGLHKKWSQHSRVKCWWNKVLLEGKLNEQTGAAAVEGTASTVHIKDVVQHVYLCKKQI